MDDGDRSERFRQAVMTDRDEVGPQTRICQRSSADHLTHIITTFFLKPLLIIIDGVIG